MDAHDGAASGAGEPHGADRPLLPAPGSRSSPAAERPALTADENRRLVEDAFERVFNQGRFELIDELYSPDFVLYTPGQDTPVRGREELRQFLSAIKAGMPDAHVTIEDIFAADDRVALSTRVVGTQTGEYRGVPPTGARVAATQTFLYRIEGGRIAEVWQEVDTLTVAQQLGVAPPSDVGPLGLIGWAFAAVFRLGRAAARHRRR